MPTPAESLKPESTDEEIQSAVSASVQQLVREGFPQDQAVQIALQQARESTGKELAPEGTSRSRRAV